MIEKVLDFIHNYFIKEVHKGTFAVTEGALTLTFLKAGQYFKIVGSDLNDGVYQYPATDLSDEEFDGEIWSLSIPKSLLSMIAEIEDWQTAYGDATATPYQSESFGGYSYSKATSGSADRQGGDLCGWQAQFASRLNHWRKIS